MKTHHNSNTTREQDAYERAKQKVTSLRGFYKHVIIYFVVNLFISLRGVSYHIGGGLSVKQALLNNDRYTLWIVWGFILFIHGVNVFSSVNIFGQKWEERKIQQYMNEETREYPK